MKLFIRELIIWPENPSLEPRAVEFQPGGVNVITGWSSTGKSAVSAIVDYVLGAKRCAIPIGCIRDTASWYGLTIDTAVGPMRLARRRPDGRLVSDDYWLQRGDEVSEQLGMPHRNASTERVKLLFDELSGLSNLTIDPENQNFGGRASFRDMAAFNFLPQHIVANPYTMFFKSDSSEYRQKLRSVLPLALGIITNEDLVRRHSLHLLQTEHRRLEAELRTRRNGLETWRASAEGTFFRAQELGLIAAGDPPANLQALIRRLQRMVDSDNRRQQNTGRTKIAIERLESLRLLEQRASKALGDYRRRLKRLNSLRGSASAYGAAVADQKSRVQGFGWFRNAISDENCVLCGTSGQAGRHMLQELGHAIVELETLSEGTRQAVPMVDREIASLESEVLEAERQLIRARSTREIAESAATTEQGREQTLESVYRFIGNTEQALRMYVDVEGETGLAARVDELAKKIRELVEDLDVAGQKRRNQDVSEKISKYILKFVANLAVGGAEGRPILDDNELNLRFEREGEKKPDFLWEIGSGENWMAYHLATLLALHGVFLKRQAGSPVPSFIIIDQPTQVYFPSDTFDERVSAGSVDSGRNGARKKSGADDLERTKQIFKALARAYSSFEGMLQIIVVDHADEKAWSEFPNVIEIENWRDDADFLIPRAWQMGEIAE